MCIYIYIKKDLSGSGKEYYFMNQLEKHFDDYDL